MEMQMRGGIFSARRFGQILFRELAGGYRSILIAMAAVAGTVIVLSVLTTLGISQGSGMTTAQTGGFYAGFFVQVLFLGGFIITSLAFREVQQNGAGIFYMTLPSSLLEKFVSKLLVTSVGYAVGSLVFYTIVAAAGEGINLLIFGFGHGLFNPLELPVLRAVGIYMITQSVFLLGSIWFRKLSLVKTVLWLAIFALGVAAIAAVTARLVLADHFVWRLAQSGRGAWSMDLSSAYLSSRFGMGSPGYTGAMVFATIGRVMFYLLAPVCWLAGYFKLGEVEV